MPFPKLDLVTPEQMLDALDNHTLDAIRAQRRGLALMLRAAGKADKLDNIAETRRCAAAIINYKPYYPPRHAFLTSPLPPGEGPGVTDPENEEDAPDTLDITDTPAAHFPSLREGAGGRVRVSPEIAATASAAHNSALLIPVNSS